MSVQEIIAWLALDLAQQRHPEIFEVAAQQTDGAHGVGRRRVGAS